MHFWHRLRFLSAIFIKKIYLFFNCYFFTCFRLDKRYLTAVKALCFKMRPAASIHIITRKRMSCPGKMRPYLMCAPCFKPYFKQSIVIIKMLQRLIMCHSPLTALSDLTLYSMTFLYSERHIYCPRFICAPFT